MTAPNQYSLEGIRRQHGDGFTLSIDYFEIARGESLCLVGPTGAGKTTFLRILTGVDHIDMGVLQFEGLPWPRGVGALGAIRSITLVPQRPIILSRSVQANVEYGLRLRGITPQDRVARVLRRLGLERLAGRPGGSLSGGQTQLVALARALVLEPKVLLLDEPTANLDPSYVRLIEEVLGEVRSERKTTLIWATHNLGQVQRVADRACLLLNGQVVESAPVDDFFHRPRDLRTATFVQGKMVC